MCFGNQKYSSNKNNKIKTKERFSRIVPSSAYHISCLERVIDTGGKVEKQEFLFLYFTFVLLKVRSWSHSMEL